METEFVSHKADAVWAAAAVQASFVIYSPPACLVPLVLGFL